MLLALLDAKIVQKKIYDLPDEEDPHIDQDKGKSKD